MAEELTKRELEELIRLVEFRMLYESDLVATIDKFNLLRLKLKRMAKELEDDR
jgi:hypothetical protein